MGGAVSSGRDNNELIDNLMGGGYIRTRSVERVFRVLDRADYMTPTERDQAYKDLAWRSGALHLSAPCIYSEVMEALELRPGLSFLNLGSGTGYLSTLVGLVIGSGGNSHGVEVHPGVVEYSTKKLTQFQENSCTLDEFDFCIPKYYSGNALCLAPLQTQYDRVYVGAGVIPKYENYFKQLIKVGGVLVMPLGDTLVQVKRHSETEWTSRQLLNVSFAVLRPPTKEESSEPLKLDEIVPPSLMLLCRAAIRRAMLAGVCRRHPELKEPAPRRVIHTRQRARRICIPLDPETDDPSLNEMHDMDAQEGGREMNALLSLVLSMGNNRAAGSLRFGEQIARPQREDELEVLIDEIEHGSSESSSSSEPDEYPEECPPPPPPPGPAVPSAAGAANLQPDVSAMRVSCERECPSAQGSTSGEAAPGALASSTELCALNNAGRIEVDEGSKGVVEKPSPAQSSGDCSDDDSKPSTSGKSRSSTLGEAWPWRAASAEPPGPPLLESRFRPDFRTGYDEPSSGPSSGPSGGGLFGGRRWGGGPGLRLERRFDEPRETSHKRFHPEVEIYFGNNGVYTGGQLRQPMAPLPPASSAPPMMMMAPTADDDAPHLQQGDSSDDEPAHASQTQGKKRQKLDSGIGEGTASGSASSDSEPSSGASSGTPDISPRMPRRRLAVHSDSGSESARPARRPRRCLRDARRVRLSIVMKRAIKELPLPYELKKYVNLHRCFQF